MTLRIAALAFALGLLAAPALGVVAASDACSPCCAQSSEPPCDGGEGSCASLTAAPCCGAAPVTPASSPQRAGDAPPLLQPAASPPRTALPVPRHVSPPESRADLARLTSPLRLSVVLRL